MLHFKTDFIVFEIRVGLILRAEYLFEFEKNKILSSVPENPFQLMVSLEGN